MKLLKFNQDHTLHFTRYKKGSFPREWFAEDTAKTLIKRGIAEEVSAEAAEKEWNKNPYTATDVVVPMSMQRATEEKEEERNEPQRTTAMTPPIVEKENEKAKKK